jgi:hypothetical protein
MLKHRIAHQGTHKHLISLHQLFFDKHIEVINIYKLSKFNIKFI